MANQTTFKKGQGGRTKGKPNKVTAEARERFKFLMDSYDTEQMQADFDALTPKERLSYISDIAEYIIPKLSRTEIEGNSNHTINWILEKTYEAQPKTNEGV